MIPKDERKEIIDRFINDQDQRLSFSVRKSIAGEFEEYIDDNGLANCVDNFLAWLSQEEQRELTNVLFAKI